MGVLFVVLDAFSDSYLRPQFAPCLIQTSKSGIRATIKPLFAFVGVGATIFTGHYPDSHEVWAEFRLRSRRLNNEVAGLSKGLLCFADQIRNATVSQGARLFLSYALNSSTARPTPNMIPAHLFRFFEPSAKRPIYSEGSLKVKTLFDWLRERKQHFIFKEASPLSGGDTEAAKVFSRMLCKVKPAFAFLKLNMLDKLGHKFGPINGNVNGGVRLIDHLTEDVIRAADKAGINKVLVIADHGMSQVSHAIDIQASLRNILPDLAKKWIMFVDSTMVRFWFIEDEVRLANEVMRILEKLQCGRIITDDDSSRLRLPKDPAHGQLTYALDEGWVFQPDFWHRGSQPLKGMHGYAFPRTVDANPILVANDEMAKLAPARNEKQFEFADVLPWIIRGVEDGCPGS